MSFPRVPVVPHIHWVTFHGGISQLVSSKSTSEKSNNTPSAGGHRSADFLYCLLCYILPLITTEISYPLKTISDSMESKQVT